jgi:hypothetical protein
MNSFKRLLLSTGVSSHKGDGGLTPAGVEEESEEEEDEGDPEDEGVEH